MVFSEILRNLFNPVLQQALVHLQTEQISAVHVLNIRFGDLF